MPTGESGIITLPHDSLRKKSAACRGVNATVLATIEKMKKATLIWEASRKHEVGVALAAVQINELHRIVIVREDFEDKTNQNFIAYIDPKIVSHSGKPDIDYEGCLSVKDIYGLVPRYPKVTITALDIEGNPIKEEVEGFQARVMQHEIDHLNGKLFIDHIKPYDVFFKLNDDGELEKLNHAKITASRILW